MSTIKLLKNIDLFNSLALRIQDEAILEAHREKALNELSAQYHAWYYEALKVLEAQKNEEIVKKFRAYYDGSLLKAGIKNFMEAGHKLYSLYNKDKPSPFLPKWTFPVERAFIQPFREQCNLLASVQYLWPSDETPSEKAEPVDERWFLLFERLTAIEAKLDRLLEDHHE